LNKAKIASKKIVHIYVVMTYVSLLGTKCWA